MLPSNSVLDGNVHVEVSLPIKVTFRDLLPCHGVHPVACVVQLFIEPVVKIELFVLPTLTVCGVKGK